MRGLKFTLRGVAPSGGLLAETFFYPKSVLDLPICVLNFNFLSLIVPEILRGSQMLW